MDNKKPKEKDFFRCRLCHRVSNLCMWVQKDDKYQCPWCRSLFIPSQVKPIQVEQFARGRIQVNFKT